jgi:hypothetical protein
MQMSHEELQDQAVEFLCEPCDEPAPPAGGEVEVLGHMIDDGTAKSYHKAFPHWAAGYELTELVDRAHVTRLQAENAALQQRLNVADQRVDELSAALDICSKWFTKYSPTAPLIGGFGDAEHPMITFIRGALSAPAAKGEPIVRDSLLKENQRITPARFKCLACGEYHEGMGGLPCPNMTPYSQVKP